MVSKSPSLHEASRRFTYRLAPFPAELVSIPQSSPPLLRLTCAGGFLPLPEEENMAVESVRGSNYGCVVVDCQRFMAEKRQKETEAEKDLVRVK